MYSHHMYPVCRTLHICTHQNEIPRVGDDLGRVLVRVVHGGPDVVHGIMRLHRARERERERGRLFLSPTRFLLSCGRACSADAASCAYLYSRQARIVVGTRKTNDKPGGQAREMDRTAVPRVHGRTTHITARQKARAGRRNPKQRRHANLDRERERA